MNIQKKLSKAEDFAKNGKFDEGVKLLNDILKKFPKQPQVHSMLGMFYIFLKQTQPAKEHFIEALSLKFDRTVATNLVSLLIQNKLWKEAYQWSQKIIENNTYHIGNLINHAMILRENSMVKESIDLYQKIISENPKNMEAKISYGFTLNKLEQYENAINIYRQGLLIDPVNKNLIYNLGITYLNNCDYDNAIKFLTLALEQGQQSFDLWLTLSVCQSKKRDFIAARQSIEQAEKLQSNHPLIPFQRGTLLMQQDKNEDALIQFTTALQYDPNHIESKYHIGLVKLKQEKYEEAMSYYQYRTIREYNRKGKFNDLNLPIIDKDSDLIISWEQGIGDQILYLSLIDEIKDSVKSITYITQDKLNELVRMNYPKLNVINDDESDKFIKTNPDFKKLNIGSIMAFIKNWDTFFNKPHIWVVDEKIKQYYLKKYKREKRTIVGMSWMSFNKKIGDEKSIPLNQLFSVISNQKTISLQYGDVQDEINKVNQDKFLNIIHDDELDYFNNINSLAALISVCDIVVTCSNVTAHIAGRLGIETYLMIPKFFGNLWYWNDSQKQSKWYPSVTIIKQNKDMSWDDPIQEVQKHLSLD